MTTATVERIDVAPLRAAFIAARTRGDVSATSLALWMGWTRTRPPRPGNNAKPYTTGDGSRIMRLLGLRPMLNGSGRRTTSRTIDYDVAHAMYVAMREHGVSLPDPVELGI